MNEHTPHPCELVSVCLAFALDAPPVRFDGRWVGANSSPAARDGNALAHGLTCRPDRAVLAIELPSAIVSHANGGGAPPVLRRLGAQERPLAARTNKRQHLGGRHRGAVGIEHHNRDALGRPCVGHTVVPRFVQTSNG